MRARIRDVVARYISLVLCLCVWLGETSRAMAQPKVSYHGVQIAVQSVKEAGPGFVQVQIIGDTFLVLEREAGRRVVLRLLAAPEVRLPASSVRDVLEKAAEAGDLEVLDRALRISLQRNEWSEFDSEDTWRRIIRTAESRDAVLQLTESSASALSPERLCAILNVVGAEEPPTPKVLELTGRYGEACARELLRRSLTGVYQGSDVAGELQIGESLLRIYRPSAELLDVARSVVDAERALIRDIASRDGNSFATALSSLQVQAQRIQLDSDSINPNPLIERFMQEATRAESFGAALAIVPMLKFEKRTPIIHQQILQSLDGISGDAAVSVGTKALQGALAQFAAKDDELANRYALMIERVVDRLIIAGQPADARGFLENIDDAEPVRNVIRSCVERVAIEYLRQGDVEAAHALVSARMTAPPLMLRVRLALGRMGLSLRSFLALFVATLAILAIIVQRRRVRASNASSMKASTSSASERPVTPEAVRAAPPQETPKPSPEYVEALSVFGLGVDVGLSEIKNAYRQAVKEHHPDAKRSPTAQDNDYFIYLTTAYERLLKLHEHELGRGALKR